MRAVVVYTVTSDGHILNARILHPFNPLFDALGLAAIKSLTPAVLQFPSGSTRNQVDMVGTFVRGSNAQIIHGEQ